MAKNRKKEQRIPLSSKLRNKILKDYDYTCVYCFDDADHVDHVIPYSLCKCHEETNLVASCWLCNLVAYNKVFDTFLDKQEFIQKRRYSFIKKNPIVIWTKEEIEELGYILRTKIEPNVIVVANENIRSKATERILKMGLHVMGRQCK